MESFDPDEDWFCDRCTYLKKHKKEEIVCCQCGQSGSAFKRTNDGRWIHIICAMWTPELHFDEEDPDLVVMDKLYKKRSTLVW